ncbi:MAG TPA: DUF2271 domain-containing protein [Lysobacter sp.]
MRIRLTIALAGLAALPVQAADIEVKLQIPQINVAEYHRPYVAVWVEGADQTALANLAVWYQQKATREGAGTKWLPDLRQWWRRSGRSLALPVDGVTGPTRPVGTHSLRVDDRNPQLAKLPAGHYTLVVEAVREVGGRELVKVPFNWRGAGTGSAKGRTELGAVSVTTRR